MSERKMAHIEKILDLQPIPNADAIEVATVLGWRVVVKKGEFKIGDMCVYCEIDAIMPERPEFEFLRQRHFRIETCKLRGQLSQGICFPISILHNVTGDQVVVTEGQDVTEVLGVTKYEMQIPAQMAGKIKGNFPSYLRKTDEHRIQAYPGIIDEFQGKEVFITQKIDGTSSTFSYRNGEIEVCSRNLSLKEDENNIYWKMFNKYSLRDKLGTIYKNTGKNICIQAECAGAGIQKNPLNLKEVNIFVFNVFDINENRFLNFSEFIQFCEENELPTVPILRVCKFEFKTIDELLELSKAWKYSSGKIAEGIVIRPIVECYSRTLDSRASFKVINNDYLLQSK